MRWKTVIAALLLCFLAVPVPARIPHGGVCSSNCSAVGGFTNITVVSPSAAVATPFSIGVPTLATLDSSHHIQAVDNTLSTTLTCDENNRYSDLTPDIRGTTLSCIIPAGSSATHTIALSVVSGAPGSGTDISIADIVASGYDMTATILTQAGTTETASALAGLNSGNTAWVNSTTSAVLGKWRSGGGIVTDYIVYVPYKSGGGTADPNGLYALFDVSCYKATTGAVSGGNPILSCHTDLLNGNGFAEQSIPLSTSYNLLAYGIAFTGQTSCTNWASSAPTQTLTFTNISYPVTISIANPAVLDFTAAGGTFGIVEVQPFLLSTTGSLPSHFSAGTLYAALAPNGGALPVTELTASLAYQGAAISTLGDTQSGTHTIWPSTTGTVTASSSLWTSDSIGTVISDGTFYGVITNVTSATVADVTVWRPKSGLSTLTSGNYHLLPINHPYGARVHFACDWTNTGAAPKRVQNGDLYLGNTWNGGTFSGGPGSYLRSAKAMLNYNLDADPGLSSTNTQIPNCPPSTTAPNCGSQPGNQGNNPSAYGSRASNTGTFACNTGLFIGSFFPDQQTSGEYPSLYMQPTWTVTGSFIYDQYGYQAIFQNVDKFASVPWNAISTGSGAFPGSASATFTWDVASSNYTRMASSASWAANGSIGYNNGCWTSWPNQGHASNTFQIPYEMTGDWYILVDNINMVNAVTATWEQCAGKGTDNQWMGCHGGGHDERSIVWPFMLQAGLVRMLPDSMTTTSTDAYKVLGFLTKTDAKSWLSAQWTSTGGGNKNYLCNQSPSFLPCAGTIYSPGVYGSATTPCTSVGVTCNPNFTDFSTPDIRFLGDNGAQFGFETGYGYNVFAQVYEWGMCDADCLQTWKWYMQGQSSYVTNNTNLSSPIAAGTVEHMDPSLSSAYPTCFWLLSGAGAATWANCWKAAYVSGWVGSQDIGIARYPTGTITLSGTTGTITVTMPASGYIAGGGTSFYNPGFLITADNGYCNNLTVTNATHFTCSVVNTFGSTSYTNTSVPSSGHLDGITLNWEIPQPAGGDSQGLEAAYLVANGQPGAGGNHYANIQQSGCIQANEYLSFPATATCNTIKAFSPTNGLGFPTQADPITFNIVKR